MRDSAYADLLPVQTEQKRGLAGRSANHVLAKMDRSIAAAEGQNRD